MISDKQRRNQLIRKIQHMSSKNLKELHDFAQKLEEDIPDGKKVLSYAGCWNDIDDSALQDLTENLISRRERNQRRFEE